MESDRPFTEIIRNEKPVLIDFYGKVAASRQLIPVVQSVKQTLGDRIIVADVNLERNQSLAEILNIKQLPTVMLFQKGRALWRKSGWVSKFELLGRIIQKFN